MKSIEIKTTQNVTLEYELADLRDRVLAFLIDFLILSFVLLVLGLVGFSAFAGSETALTVFSVFLTCVFLFYSLAFEIFSHGQSFGKMAMKIQVIKTVGGRATYSDYAARWVFRMIDIYFSLGGIASILISSSAKAQRIGDMVANTAVVKLTPQVDLDLEDLLRIQSRESYTPQFKEVKHLHEEDVLLIKSTLSRYQRYRNSAHQEAIGLLAQQMRSVLGLGAVPGNDLDFLKTLLKDYVVLTR